MKRNRRYLLLPGWIRFFSWLFLLMGCFTVPFAAVLLIIDKPASFMLFGFNYYGTIRAPFPLLVCAVFFTFGYVGYLLLWGKKEGRKFGLICGYSGLWVVLISTFLVFSRGHVRLPLEPLFQIPFVVKLHRLKKKWEEADEPPVLTQAAVTPVTGPPPSLP